MNPRRRFLGYLAGSLGAMAASGLFWTRQRSRDDPAGRLYQVVARWRLAAGGLGLFIATEGQPAKEQLKALGQGLRQGHQDQPNLVVMVFDDAEAARTVRKGSRVVGEEPFQAALGHQVAFYVKDSRAGRHSFTIYGEPQEVVQYRGP